MIKYNNIIKSPILTEKASFLREKFNKYSLYVFANASKRQIKLAIESLFDVKISSMNVLKIKPKSRRFRGVVGCEKQKKKVYFSLMDGQKLDIMSV
ncbi:MULTISPECIES: 50S ribosomal protein L23 [unclassified Wolbachia]|uniref:50S ribosomal protein L23 n=1 Tax=unclassified Wolbachia TaxID=2640676 RepID=UPI000A5C8E29|nr:50S ribosomal protein L23 [Wolbachia endosymbiont of Folsomia candida]APR98007.1 50S ribosomal protein L23 [Wolbachia endosymbiont of Folsomia candida]